jgi:geranylgeranyl pyrophosphate synthase
VRDLEQVRAIMLGELECWPWQAVTAMRGLVERQLQQPGKQLRPRLGLAIADVFGARPEPTYPAVASIEFYHAASLILDDIQDGSDFRHGARSLHTTVGTGMAINVAATIRSLSYHTIHRSSSLRDDQKLDMHRRLDTAATHLLLGQSIDIGWNLDWYPAREDFPYEQMAAWKTGALFGCAASMAAVASEVALERVDAAEQIGTAFGVLYQMIDDYRDTFGTATGAEPVGDDIARGRPGYPEIVLRRVNPGSAARAGSHAQIRELMKVLGIEHIVRRRILREACSVVEAARTLNAHAGGVAELVASVLALVGMNLNQPGAACQESA